MGRGVTYRHWPLWGTQEAEKSLTVNAGVAETAMALARARKVAENCILKGWLGWLVKWWVGGIEWLLSGRVVDEMRVVMMVKKKQKVREGLMHVFISMMMPPIPIWLLSRWIQNHSMDRQPFGANKKGSDRQPPGHGSTMANTDYYATMRQQRCHVVGYNGLGSPESSCARVWPSKESKKGGPRIRTVG